MGNKVINGWKVRLSYSPGAVFSLHTVICYLLSAIVLKLTQNGAKEQYIVEVAYVFAFAFMQSLESFHLKLPDLDIVQLQEVLVRIKSCLLVHYSGCVFIAGGR